MLAVFVGTVTIERQKTDLRILFLFLVFGIIINGVTFILGDHGINNLWVFHFYTLAENIAYLSIFYLWIPDGRVKKAIIPIMVVFAILWIISKFTFENINTFDSYTSSLSGAIIAIIAVYMIYNIISGDEVGITSNYRFLISFGVLFYFSVVLLMFALSNLVYLGYVNSYANIVAKLSICWGFIVACRE